MNQLAKLSYSTAEAMQALGIKRSRLFALMASGAIRSFKEGSTRLISARALAEYVERKEAEAAGQQEEAA